MSEPLKKTLPIQNLEIKISNDSSIPHVILNGVDFQAEDIGLQALYIFHATRKDKTGRTVIQVDFINGRELPREISIYQKNY